MLSGCVCLLWKHHIEKIFGAFLLFQVIGSSFFDESLQIVGVLLHSQEEVVQNVATVALPADDNSVTVKEVVG